MCLAKHTGDKHMYMYVTIRKLTSWCMAPCTYHKCNVNVNIHVDTNVPYTVQPTNLEAVYVNVNIYVNMYVRVMGHDG